MAACSETSFSPTRTARPSSERSYRYRWSCSSNSAALRTAVVDIEKTLSRQVRDGGRELLACLRKRRGLEDLPPLQLEIEPAEQADRGVVVDDQDGMAGRFHAAG